MMCLYRCTDTPIRVPDSAGEGRRVVRFKPTVFHVLMKEDRRNPSLWLRNFFWLCVTFGRFYVYAVLDGDQVIHSSCVMEKCYKFRFMKKGDIHVGPVETVTRCRGQGILPHVLADVIRKDFPDAGMYCVIRDSNTASQKAFAKAGFTRIGTVKKTKMLKMYHRCGH